MSDNLDAVKMLHSNLLEAWNRGDAPAMASLYAPNGSQVGFDGSVANGPEEIGAQLAAVFADHQVARFVWIVREVRSLAPDVILLRAVAGMVPPGKTKVMPERNTIQTVVGSRTSDGRWQIELFQNTPAKFDGRPEEVERLTWNCSN